MEITILHGTENDLQPMLDLDDEVYTSEGIVTFQSVIDRFNKDKYQYLVAKDEEGRLQGYLNIVSIPDHAFKAILNGTWIESEDLTIDNVLGLTPETEINIYITSIVARKRGQGIATKLLNGLHEMYFAYLSSQKIRVKNIVAITFSKEGEIVFKKLGFKSVKKMKPLENGFIPWVQLLDLTKESKSLFVQQIQKINNK